MLEKWKLSLKAQTTLSSPCLTLLTLGFKQVTVNIVPDITGSRGETKVLVQVFGIDLQPPADVFLSIRNLEVG